jgi:hypothetical protein
MKTMRIAALAAVMAGAAVGLASPASAELLDGTYDQTNPDGHTVAVVFTSCGADCKHADYPGTSAPQREYHLKGNTWTASIGKYNEVETIDNDTLAYTMTSSVAGNHAQLVKVG